MFPFHGRRWTVRTLAGLVLGASLGISASFAQPGPTIIDGTATPLPKKVFTKNAKFELPIQMDERTRSQLREVCLYVRYNGGEWVRQDVAAPTSPKFVHTVTQDGEYWFKLVTIDRNNRSVPADVSQGPPDLRVVVDTKAPVLDVRSDTVEGEACLHVAMADANPDLSSIRVVVKTELGERVVGSVAAHPNHFKIAANDMNQTIRITGTDQCGNTSTRELQPRDVLTTPVQNVDNRVVVPGAITSPVAGVPKLPTLPPLPQEVNTVPALISPPVTPPTTPPMLPAIQPSLPPVTPVLPTNGTGTATSSFRIDPTATAPTTVHSTGGRKLLNTTRAQFEFRVDQVGQTGVSKIETYLTADDGQTWTRHGEVVDRRSPADIDFPGEGVFGLRLAVTNIYGFGGQAPVRGDAPLFTVEVDTTPPEVTTRSVELVPHAGAIDIRWSAKDRNLGSEPVSLFYRSRSDATWVPIVRGVKNDGVHRWVFPRDIGPQFFLKVEVADQAGNVAQREFAQPVTLDTTVPNISVVGVTPRPQ